MKSKLRIVSIFSFIIFSLVIVSSGIYILNNREFESEDSSASETIPPTEAKVMVFVYYGGHRPKEEFDYTSLIDQTESSIETASRYGIRTNTNADKSIDYTIVDRKIIDSYTPQIGLNCEQYLPRVQNGDWTEQDAINTNCWGFRGLHGTADYHKIINDNQICERFNNGEFDEIWLYGFNNAGLWEANMTGVGAFYTNGYIVPDTSCKENMHIMGFSYQWGINNILHSFGHRMESIYERFQDYRYVNEFFRDCGTVHFPPNGTYDYDYTNTTLVTVNCDDWNPQDSSPPEVVNAATWGGTYEGYMYYWLQSIPGKGNNIIDVDGQAYMNVWDYFLYDYEIGSPKEIGLGDAVFTSSYIEGTRIDLPANITFTPTSSPGSHDFHWVIGFPHNGQGDTEVFNTNFLDPGMYEIILTYSDANGKLYSGTKTINIVSKQAIIDVHRFTHKPTLQDYYIVSQYELPVYQTSEDYVNKGIEFKAYRLGNTRLKPVHLFTDMTNGGQIYTQNTQEYQAFLNKPNRYWYHGIFFYAFFEPGAKRIAVHRFYDRNTRRYKYETNPKRIENFTQLRLRYRNDGIIFYGLIP